MQLATGSKDQFVKLWDTATGRLLQTLPRFESSIQSIAFSSNGRLLAVGQFGRVSQPMQVWDLVTRKALVPADDDLGCWAPGVAFSPDGQFLAACGEGLTIWRVAKGEQCAGNALGLALKRQVHLPGHRSLYLAISADSRLLAWVDNNYSICLWDLANGREIPFLAPPLSYGWHNLAFYPDSNHLTFLAARGMFETWDTRTAKRVSTLGPGGGGVAASRDGRWFLGGAERNVGRLWSSHSRSPVFSLPQETGAIWGWSLSPDNERLAFGLADGGVTIWSVPKIQAQLTRIGLAWHADARPRGQQEPQPFIPTTPLEEERQVNHYLNLGNRLTRRARLREAEDAYRAALKLRPDDPVAHEKVGASLWEQGRSREAEPELSEAIRLRPEHGWFWVLRGWAYADMGQWEKASADWVKATECSEPDEEAWYSLALLHLRDGDFEAYREACSEMLRRYGQRATWTCTLSPNSGVDPPRLVRLAEKILTELPRNHWHLTQLGAALYRAGRFEEAVKVLNEATEINVDPYRTNMLHTWFYLAMAHHRLGHADQARHWLEKGDRGLEEVLESRGETAEKWEKDGVFPPTWHRRLTFELQRREAEQVIQGQ
jgi:tetratricopeptide (TPR) repeat protein